MTVATDPELLVLQALRVKGRTEPAVIAELHDLTDSLVSDTLDHLEHAGWAKTVTGSASGWMLTDPGRVHGEALMAAELDASGGRAVVEAGYAEFRPLNRELLAVCTRWQVKAIDGEQIINDHTDPGYDDAVIDDLYQLDRHVRPILADLSGVLSRFGIYDQRFDIALRHLSAGELEWFTRPILDSYHTVWFELHEDFFGTLGIDRASESLV